MSDAPQDTESPSEAPILVVEDDDEIREVMKLGLEVEGYAVLEARNGREALDVLRAAGPKAGLILLDLMMPVMDGLEFRVQQQSDPSIASIPVVLVSALGRLEARAESLGAVGSMHKPFDLETLLAVVKRERAAPGAGERGEP